MSLKIKVDGFITIDVPSVCSTDENVKQKWLNEISSWVKYAQEELNLPEYDGAQAYVEDIDFVVVN